MFLQEINYMTYAFFMNILSRASVKQII